jgi:hypothetical protein
LKKQLKEIVDYKEGSLDFNNITGNGTVDEKTKEHRILKLKSFIDSLLLSLINNTTRQKIGSSLIKFFREM